MRKNPKYSPKAMEVKNPSPDDELAETSKLIMKPCKFWKTGKCNWGWGCRFLHGNDLSDDPRRPEYRGLPVDFTQFPRPSFLSAQHNFNNPYYHTDEQLRSKRLRNPIVEITVSSPSSLKFASTLKGILLKNNIDILQQNTVPIINHEDAAILFKQNKTDFLIFINSSSVIMFPDSVSLQTNQIVPWIQRHYRIMCKNLTSEEIELMTPTSLEMILKSICGPQLTIDDITPTITKFQDKVNCAVISQGFPNFKAKSEDLVNLRLEILIFFGKLNLLNSIITDYPLYGNIQPIQGQSVPVSQEKPNGMSFPLQRSLLYMTEQFMTQVHVCLASITKMLGELNKNRSLINFTVATSTAAGLHPSPFCFASYDEILTMPASKSPPKTDIFVQSRSSQFPRRSLFDPSNVNTKIEPDIVVNMNSPYQISFRDHNDSNEAYQRPFNQ